MQLEGADGAAVADNGVIGSDGAKENTDATEEPGIEGGDTVRSVSAEENMGGEPQRGKEKDADADKDEEKGDAEGTAEDTTGIFPAARVKRIMRKNPDKKKNFGKETVQVVALATELFLQDMTKQCYQYTAERKRRTMMLNDVGDCIKSVPRYEFLDGPGILPEPSEKAKRAKTAAPATDKPANSAAGQPEAAPTDVKEAPATLLDVKKEGTASESTGGDGQALMVVDPPQQPAEAVVPAAPTQEGEQPMPMEA